MNILALDTEVTTHNKGNPFDRRNKLVCISWWWQGEAHAEQASPELFKHIQELIDATDILIGFNFKFDLHWLRNVGIRCDGKRLFDCQLAEFVVTKQLQAYPSLEGCCVKYGLGHKLDIIKTEYWNKGINTDAIPWDILKEYAALDAHLTYKLYETQLKLLNQSQLQLLNLQFQDLHILAEMEWNGLKYDESLCKERSAALHLKKTEIEQQLRNVYPDIPINFGSPDQLSAFLYGGTIDETIKVHEGFYKSGAKTGQPKYRNQVVTHTLPRLYTPIEGSKLAKEGKYSTSEDYLLKLNGDKKTVGMLLELAKIDKLLGTYYEGLPLKNLDMHWEPQTLHGQFNQCVAKTGRLSSSNPNLQNFASELNDILVTRF